MALPILPYPVSADRAFVSWVDKGVRYSTSVMNRRDAEAFYEMAQVFSKQTGSISELAVHDHNLQLVG